MWRAIALCGESVGVEARRGGGVAARVHQGGVKEQRAARWYVHSTEPRLPLARITRREKVRASRHPQMRSLLEGCEERSLPTIPVGALALRIAHAHEHGRLEGAKPTSAEEGVEAAEHLRGMRKRAEKIHVCSAVIN